MKDTISEPIWMTHDSGSRLMIRKIQFMCLISALAVAAVNGWTRGQIRQPRIDDLIDRNSIA
jgi:hypothetical protein